MDINKPTEHVCVSRYVLIPQNIMPELVQLEQKFCKDRRQHNEAVLWKFADILYLFRVN